MHSSSISQSSTFKLALILVALFVLALMPGHAAAAPTTYTFTVAGSAPGAEMGSGTLVSTAPAPGSTINCALTTGTSSGDCSDTGISNGTTYTVVATPSAGSTFSEWIGCDSVSSTNVLFDTCTVNVTSDRTVYTRFNSLFEIHTLAWDTLGMDSNFPVTTGPHIFPMGYRVCNISTTMSYDVTVSFEWLADPVVSALEPPPNLPGGAQPGAEDQAGTYIHIQTGNVTTITKTLAAWDGADYDPSIGGTQSYFPMSLDSLNDYSPTPAHCADFYYNVELEATSLGFFKYRWYEVNASVSGTEYATLPDHYIYVEKLNSQNRNNVTGFCDINNVTLNPDGSCPAQNTDVVVVGETYDYRVTGLTKDFAELVLSVNFPNNLFQVNWVDTIYGDPAVSTDFNNALYSDACIWNRLTRACQGAGKAGGAIRSDESITVLGPGVTVVEPLIYDISGSSYHYNTEFNTTTYEITIQSVYAAEPDLAKTVYGGWDSGAGCATATDAVSYPIGTPITYCFTITNNTTDTVLDTSDTLLTNWEITDTLLGITGTADLTPVTTPVPTSLAPGESFTYYYEFTIPAGWAGATTKNIAGVTTDTAVLSAADNTTLLPLPGTYATTSDTEIEQLNGNNDADVFADPLAVRLDWFKAEDAQRAIALEWATGLETGNVGFNVFAENADGSLTQLNREPIPSHTGDSVEPQFYSFEARSRGSGIYWLQDVDTSGNETMHGPFRIGEEFGARPVVNEIDWASIEAEHEAKAQGRANAAVASARQNADAAANAMRHGRNATFPTYEIRVNADGMYRIDYETLVAAGLDLRGLSPALIAISAPDGTAVPLQITGGKVIGPGTALIFYGEGLDTLYTDTNVYRLTVNATQSAAIANDAVRARNKDDRADYYMETAEIGDNNQYIYVSPNGDPWYDTRMLVFGTEKAWTFAIPVDNYAGDVAPATLDVSMYGVTDYPGVDPDHHVNVAFNGQTVGGSLFNGLADASTSAQVSGISDGDNNLTLTMPADTGAYADLVNFEGASLTYPRAFVAQNNQLAFSSDGEAFEITGFSDPHVLAYRIDDAGNVAWLSGATVKGRNGNYSVTVRGTGSMARYVVTTFDAMSAPDLAPMPQTNLPSGQTDFLIISHPDFIDGLAPLVAAREAEGYSVSVANVEDVYTQYSGGVFDPQAIADYIRFAHENMGTRYTLLVGGDTYDYRGYLNGSSVSFVPTLYAQTDEAIKFAPSDPLFADTDGDNIPNVALGRFPVRTSAQLDALVGKTLAYSNKDYGNTAVFAADQTSGGTSYSDISDSFASTLPGGWDVTRAYIDEMGVADARATLLNAMNNGVALTNYFGHSSHNRWTAVGLFVSADAPALTNGGRPTVVSQWGCWNTYFVTPSYDTLGHTLLLSGDRGAAAVMGSSTFSYAYSEQALGELMTPLLVQPGMTIGDAMLQAKSELGAAHPEMLDALLGWTILGDPTLAISQ